MLTQRNGACTGCVLPGKDGSDQMDVAGCTCAWDCLTGVDGCLSDTSCLWFQLLARAYWGDVELGLREAQKDVSWRRLKKTTPRNCMRAWVRFSGSAVGSSSRTKKEKMGSQLQSGPAYKGWRASTQTEAPSGVLSYAGLRGARRWLLGMLCSSFTSRVVGQVSYTEPTCNIFFTARQLCVRALVSRFSYCSYVSNGPKRGILGLNRLLTGYLLMFLNPSPVDDGFIQITQL